MLIANILASHENPTEASHLLQTHLDQYAEWLQQWRIKVNETICAHHLYFEARNMPPGTIKWNAHTTKRINKILGVHLDRLLTWRTHIFTKRKQLGIKLSQMYWLMGTQSELTIENKLLAYKTILKPIWTYGAPLWGSASTYNIEILQRFQNKVHRTIVNAPWYVSNNQLHTDLGISSVREEITNISHEDKLTAHPNELATTLLNDEVEPQRLKWFKPADLMKQHL
jgi:hypothetical protein